MDGNLSELVVVKRSGQRIVFNGTKIAVAIKYAFDNVCENNEESVNKIYSKVLEYISTNYSDRKTINVEDIQDIIETILKENGYSDVYNAFKEYRVKRSASRDIFDRKQQHKFVKATEKLVLAANHYTSSSPKELLISFGKTISSEFSKAYLIDSKYIRSHDEGAIYIHNLDYYVLSTISSTILDLYNIEVCDDYFNKILTALINIKDEKYGSEGIPSIDYLFIPYVLYKFKSIFEKILGTHFEKEGFIEYINIKGINNVIQKLNTIYIDFSLFDKYLLTEKTRSILSDAYNYSIKELRSDLKFNIKSMLITLNELRCGIDNNAEYSISIGTNDTKDGIFIRNIYFDVINELDRLESVFTIYKCKNNDYLENISKLICLNKNIAVSFVNTSYYKDLYKNDSYKFEVEHFSNGDKITDNIYERSSTSIGRMNIAKTSINLVRIALNSKDKKDFYNSLSNTLELVKNELLQKFEYISSKYKENFDCLFSENYLMDNEKLESGQKIKKVIRNGCLSIGYVGLSEVKNLLKLSHKEVIDIIRFIRTKCDEYTTEYKINFNLRETDEDVVLTYLKGLDKSIYGSIEDVTDKEHYSIYSESLSDNFKERFEIEKELHKYSNGGYKEVISLPKNYSYKKLYEILILASESDIGFIKFNLGRSV